MLGLPHKYSILKGFIRLPKVYKAKPALSDVLQTAVVLLSAKHFQKFNRLYRRFSV